MTIFWFKTKSIFFPVPVWGEQVPGWSHPISRGCTSKPMNPPEEGASDGVKSHKSGLKSFAVEQGGEQSNPPTPARRELPQLGPGRAAVGGTLGEDDAMFHC